MKNAYLCKQDLKELGISAEAKAAYAAIMLWIGKSTDKIYYLSPELLCFSILGNASFEEKDIEIVKRGLDELEKRRFISREDSTANGAVFDLSKIENDWLRELSCKEQLYLEVAEDDIHKIFNCEFKLDKYKLFQAYLAWLIMMKEVVFENYFDDEVHKMELGKIEPNFQTEYFYTLEKLGVIFVCDRRKENVFYCRGSEAEFMTNFLYLHTNEILDMYL